MAGTSRPALGQNSPDRPGFENLEARGIQRFVFGQPSFDCAPAINNYLANMGEGDNQRSRGVFLPAGSWSIAQPLFSRLKSGGALVGVSPNSDLYGDEEAAMINGAITRIVARGFPADTPMLTVEGIGLKLEGIFFQGAGGSQIFVKNPANWADTGLFIKPRAPGSVPFGPGQVHGDWLQFGACKKAIVCGFPGQPTGNQAEELVFQRLSFFNCGTGIEINNNQSVNHTIQDIAANGCTTVLDLVAGGVFEIGLMYVGKLDGTDSPTIIRTGTQAAVSPNANFVHINSLRLDGSLVAPKIWEMTAASSFIVKIDALGVASNTPPATGTAHPYVVMRGGGRLVIGSAMNLTEGFIEGHEVGGVAPVITINNAVMWPGDSYRKLVKSSSMGKTIVRLSGVVERDGSANPVSEEQIWNNGVLTKVQALPPNSTVESLTLTGTSTLTGNPTVDTPSGLLFTDPADNVKGSILLEDDVFIFKQDATAGADLLFRNFRAQGTGVITGSLEAASATFGAPLAPASGGTGAGTLTGLVLGNGTAPMTTVTNSAGLRNALSDENGTGAAIFDGASAATFVEPKIQRIVISPSAAFDLNAAGASIFKLDLGATGNAIFSVGVQVPDAPYNSATWNGSLLVPTRGALWNKFEALAPGGVVGPSSGGTGLTSLGTGVATFLQTPSSANLAAAVTGDTGSGALVFGTSPTITTPNITQINIGGTQSFTIDADSSPLFVVDASANQTSINQPLTLAVDLTVPNGGTGASALTGVLIGNNTSPFTAAASSTDGQVLRRASGAYSFGALDLASASAVTGALPNANVADDLTISGGTVNNTVIGGVTPAAASFTGAMIAGGTVTSSTPLLAATQTWNSSGTTFRGIELNITDTNAANGSTFLRGVRNGGEVFQVNKYGVARFKGINGAAGEYNAVDIGCADDNGQFPVVTAGGTGAEGVSVRSTSAYAWTSSSDTSAFASRDTFLKRTDPAEVGVQGASSAEGSFKTDGIRLGIVPPKTTAYTIIATDYFIPCNAASTGFNVNLPAADLHAGRVFCIKKVDGSGNGVTIVAAGSDTIDGAGTKAITVPYNSYMIISDGDNWHVLAGVGL